MRARRQRRAGFTLVELLLALAIFSLVAAMAAGTFWSVLKAWNRGGEMLEQLHYGEFAMEQLVTALRGAAWFPSKPSAFGFWLENGKASWVTSGSAFLPPDSPLINGLHRISVSVDSVGGARGLVVRAWPHLTDPEELELQRVVELEVAPELPGRENRDRSTAPEQAPEEQAPAEQNAATNAPAESVTVDEGKTEKEAAP